MLLQLIQFYRRMKMGKYGWHGNYHDWMTASEKVKGYNEDTILQKVLASTLKVKNGEAVYERDGMIMSKIEHSWPLLSQLLYTAIKQDQQLHIVDFGGSLGSSYFQNRAYLKDVNLKWDVVEQDNYVKVGKQSITTDQLQFHFTITEAIDKNGRPDLLLLGCVLPYLPDPCGLLLEMISYEIPTIIIDNTYFHDRPGDRLTIQNVPPIYYDAAYPAWFLDYEKIKEILSVKYKIREEYTNEQFLYLDGRKIDYKGLVADLR